jgi:GntR family transcriptional regulator
MSLPAGEVGSSLYERVAAQLRQRLRDLDLRPGDLLESERLLVEELAVSRITLRRAIDLLVDEQLLVRRQGVGTFVASPRLTHPLVGLHSTRDLARALDVAFETQIVSFGVGVAGADERSRLDLGVRDRVVRLVRRDSLRGRPVAAAECVLPERLLGAVSAEDLAGRSTYELLEERGVPIASARQVLRAEPAAAKAAGLLGVVEGSPLLVLDRLTFDAAGAPVEVGRVSYPHDIAECARPAAASRRPASS